MENATVLADQMMDLRGLTCPMPMLKTKKALQGMASGQILEVWGTDPGSKNDIPDFCRKFGNEVLCMEDVAEGHTQYVIRKG